MKESNPDKLKSYYNKDGSVQEKEVIIFEGDKSADREKIEKNINNYYKIYKKNKRRTKE